MTGRLRFGQREHALSRLGQRSVTAGGFLLLLLAVAGVRAQSELVIQKTGTKEYHRPGCPVISDGKDVLALTRAQAESRGLKPHQCDPPDRTTTAGETAAKPTDVYVDGGKYYHLEKCTKLETPTKKLTLDEAGRKFWPCPTCKPPIRKRPR